MSENPNSSPEDVLPPDAAYAFAQQREALASGDERLIEEANERIRDLVSPAEHPAEEDQDTGRTAIEGMLDLQKEAWGMEPGAERDKKIHDIGEAILNLLKKRTPHSGRPD